MRKRSLWWCLLAIPVYMALGYALGILHASGNVYTSLGLRLLFNIGVLMPAGVVLIAYFCPLAAVVFVGSILASIGWALGFMATLKPDAQAGITAFFVLLALGPAWLLQTILGLVVVLNSKHGRLSKSRDLWRCRTCGYNLTGAPGPRCPECGCATKSLGKEDCEVDP